MMDEVLAGLGAPASCIEGYVACHEWMDDSGIHATRNRSAHFFGQAAHESGMFRYTHELGGRAYFDKYNGRADLGNGPKDGYLYRGRGWFQLTGRANYREYGKMLGLPLEDDPELAAHPEVAWKVAATYFLTRKRKGLTVAQWADKDDLEQVTRAINGGVNGLEDRRRLTARARTLIEAAAKSADLAFTRRTQQ